MVMYFDQDRRIRNIFSIAAAAMERPEVDRQTFLDEACASDWTLRREIDSILDEIFGNDQLPELSRLALRHSPDMTNRILADRYQCLSSLGCGSFGDVWLAEDLKLDRKQVVVKILRMRQGAKQLNLHSLKRELAALARLDHPSIVGITDTGVNDEGQSFIVLTYVSGVTVREEITGIPWDVGRVTRLIIRLARALDYAHQAGIVHGDLKPENIVLRHPATFSEQPFLIDFGLSRLLADQSQDAAGVVIGTKGYTPPQQYAICGTPAGDIFSLAIIAVELLLGDRPDVNTIIESSLRKRLGDAQPSLLETSKDALCLALAESPKRRFVGVAEFAQKFVDDFENFSDPSEPVWLAQSFSTSRRKNFSKLETQPVMSTQPPSFTNDLGQITNIRRQFGEYAHDLAEFLEQKETENGCNSGALDLHEQIRRLRGTHAHLFAGNFRIMIVGDIKQGKSTIVNVLLGENLLPSAVTKCTAVLTVVRFGLEKKVTVHFNSETGRPPENLTFAEFRQRYTIQNDAAERLEKSGRHAFPEVTHAVVEYPLELLKNGVEIIDSPGLNDTRELNRLTLGFIQECHAVLFVLDGHKGMTMTEKQYIEDYLEGQGLTVFFLLNKWDVLLGSVPDENDVDQIRNIEAQKNREFRRELESWFQENASGTYEERVFPLSARDALRQQVKNPQANLSGTGFPEFQKAFISFLAHGRLAAEIRATRLQASGIYKTVREKINLRIPLLSKSVRDLEVNIKSVQPEFDKLTQLRNRFSDEINMVGEETSRVMSDGLRTYILGLEATFESDFGRYQPELPLMALFSKSKRQEFQHDIERSFERYFSAKIMDWTKNAEKDLQLGFAKLETAGVKMGYEYAQVTDRIAEKLTGVNNPVRTQDDTDNESSWLTRLLAAGGALMFGDIVGAGMAAGNAFNWRSVMLNVLGVISVNLLVYLFAGVVLSPFAIILPALGLAAWQAAQTKKKITAVLKSQLQGKFSEIAESAWNGAYSEVKRVFEGFRKSVSEAIDQDIQSRRAELDNLRRQKESSEINRDAEIQRLHTIDAGVLERCHVIEKSENEIISAMPN